MHYFKKMLLRSHIFNAYIMYKIKCDDFKQIHKT